METPFHGKLREPLAREQPACDSVTLPVETFQMTKHLLTPSHAKSRKNTEAILKTCGLSFDEDIHKINNSFCKMC